MNPAIHHVWVVLRLLGTTRGGLVAMLVLINCVPMVAMSMFIAGGEHRFAYGYTPETFAFSLLFAPLSRWTLGLALGRHAGRTTAAGLPLSPRGRAVAEAVAVVLGLWVPAAMMLGLAAGMLEGSDLAEAAASIASLCGAISALALPHLLLASLDRESPYGHRIWIRWLAAPGLVALGLALPGTRSLVGYVVVGLAAAAVLLAWGPVSWIGSSRPPAGLLAPLDPRAIARPAPDDPVTTLSRDFWRGLGIGGTRGLLWALALLGPLVLLRWWRFPALTIAGAVVIAAVVAGGFPLGLRARVVGGRWANNGDFGRSWSVLPIPGRVLIRAVYLYILVCSATVLVVVAVALSVVVTRAPAAIEVTTTGALLASVVTLGLVGIRTHAAVGTRFSWQVSWFVSGSAVGCVWLSRFAFDAPQHSVLSAGLAALGLLASVGVAVSPMSALRPRGSHASPRAVSEG